MNCPECNQENTTEATSCVKCGFKFPIKGKRKNVKDDAPENEKNPSKDTKKEEVVIAIPRPQQVLWGFGNDLWWEAKNPGGVVYVNTEKVTPKGRPAVTRPILALAKIISHSVGARGDVPRPLALLESDKADKAKGTQVAVTGKYGLLATPYCGDVETKLHLWSPELYQADASAEESEAEKKAEEDALKELEEQDELAAEQEDKELDAEQQEAEKQKSGDKFVLDLGLAKSDAPKGPVGPIVVKAETDMDQMVTTLDKGHLFALALGGIDHSAQIVPQVRTCNRGAWLRMETRIAAIKWGKRGRNKLAELRQKAAQAKMQVDGQKKEANLVTQNTIGENGDVIGRIYLFYHQPDHRDFDWDKLIRIPAWFYFQIFYVVNNEAVGIGHYSMGNGRPVVSLCPTQDEITAFLRAHKALDFNDPRQPENQKKIQDGQWYPDPPYAALQWLSDNGDPVIRFRNFSAAGFSGDEIDIIRKYNWWLNGGACDPTKGDLRSDHREIVRTSRLALTNGDIKLMDDLLTAKKLTENQTERLAQLVAAQRIEVSRITVRSKPFPKDDAEIKEWVEALGRSWTEADWDNLKDLQVTQDKIDKAIKDEHVNQKRLLEKQKKQLIKANGKLMGRIEYLEILAPPNNRLLALEHMQKDGKAKGNSELEQCAEAIKGECRAVKDDLDIEQPDLYPTLDLSGGRGYPEVDHIVPKNRNGKNRYDNARLVSFAQNHIYRDKVYLSPNRTESIKEKARQRCAANYEKEKERLKKHTDFLRQHTELVDEFRRKPDERLIPMIRDFIKEYDVKLDDRSERPEAPVPVQVAIPLPPPQQPVVQQPVVQPVVMQQPVVIVPPPQPDTQPMQVN
jgi:hypothetical protein